MAAGTEEDPWNLTTAPDSSAYTMHREEGDPALLVCQVGSTRLTYLARAVEDLHSWLLAQGRNGYRGRFGMYLPPLLEALGLAELTHDARNNSMRGI